MGLADLYAIQITSLSRVYQTHKRPPRNALNDLTLSVAWGKIHGLLGPNGSGKTTLCKILSTVLLPTSGSARIAGYDVVKDTAAVRQVLGIVFGGERGLYGRLTARQNLMYWSALYKQPKSASKTRVAALLDRVGLQERADERVETYSRGMKQRLHLARGLIGNPQVVVLDEPTVGMDPVAAHEFRSLVSEIRAEGRTILLTTHDMAEAEAICDQVSLIDHGRLLATQNPRTIGKWLSSYERVSAQGVDESLVRQVLNLPGVVNVKSTTPGYVCFETTGEGASGMVMRYLLDSGITLMSTSPPSLEEVYLHVIGGRGLEIE